MFDRRTLLKSGAAGATLALLSTPRLFTAARAAATKPAPTPAQRAAGKKLNALFDQFVQEGLDHAPEAVTSLGLDKGKRAHQKYELSQASLAEIARNKAMTADQYKRLKAIDRNALDDHDRTSYDVVMFGLEHQVQADNAFDYGGGGAGSPYVVSQLTGAYQSIPDFLDSQHSIATKNDAEAYLSRLDAFARQLDQEDGVVKHDAGLGVVPPDFVLSRALDQMTKLRGIAAQESVLVKSVARRTKEKIPGQWDAQATKIVAEKVYPALDRQIALMKSLQKKATHDAGVWRLPKGEEYYHDSLIQWTTSTKDPAEIHQIGRDAVARYGAQIDAIMKAHGMTKGTVGERLRAMYNDPKYRYPNTDAGKEKLLADLNKKVQAVRARLPKYFDTLPKANLVIKRVPTYIEAGAPGGYYNLPALDGSRPGIYYINLRDTAEVPSWTLPTLTFHEGIPGHHLQLSIQTEADIPLIRKLTFFSSYAEGWALYAEQLAAEMGMYDNDPMGHIGQLHDAMFRGVRLVVDTGMHAMKWSREKAIKYYVDTLGDQEASATTEIERYCVWPGQACSYLLGKLKILELRKKAKTALGARFDIKKFHDAILLNGAVPLSVLETEVDGYIQAAKA
jgi:uncharacterized protein (DUF885 family)